MTTENKTTDSPAVLDKESPDALPPSQDGAQTPGNVEGAPDPDQAPAQVNTDSVDGKPQDQGATQDQEVFEYPTYNDRAADAAVGLLKQANVDPRVAAEIFNDAITSGDLTKVNLEKLVDAVGKDRADLIMIGVNDFYNRRVAEVNKMRAAANDIFGGEENRLKVVSWAEQKAKVDPAFAARYAEIIEAADKGENAVRMVAREMKQLFENDPKNGSLGMKQTQGDAGTPPSFEPISQREYAEKRLAAWNKGDMAEFEALQVRRRRTRELENK